MCPFSSSFLSTGEWWGATEHCLVTSDNTTDTSFLSLKSCNPPHVVDNCTYSQSSTTQFWERYVLDLTPGLQEFGDLGGFGWKLPLALFGSWTVVFLCLMKGVKSSGKVREKKDAVKN